MLAGRDSQDFTVSGEGREGSHIRVLLSLRSEGPVLFYLLGMQNWYKTFFSHQLHCSCILSYAMYVCKLPQRLSKMEYETQQPG